LAYERRVDQPSGGGRMNCDQTRIEEYGVREIGSARMEPTSAGSRLADIAGVTPAWASAQTEHE